MRLRRRIWTEKRVAEWDERDATAAFVLAFVGIADNHPGESMAPDEMHHVAIVFRRGGFGDRYVAWRYKQGVGAIQAIYSVQCCAYGSLVKALDDAKAWAMTGRARTDLLEAVPAFDGVTYQARQACVYTLQAVPADLGREYVDLWDWDRDDVVTPR